jgi:hypothetical protein
MISDSGDRYHRYHNNHSGQSGSQRQQPNASCWHSLKGHQLARVLHGVGLTGLQAPAGREQQRRVVTHLAKVHERAQRPHTLATATASTTTTSATTIAAAIAAVIAATPTASHTAVPRPTLLTCARATQPPTSLGRCQRPRDP